MAEVVAQRHASHRREVPQLAMPAGAGEQEHEQRGIAERDQQHDALDQCMPPRDRQRVVWGKSVSARVDIGGSRLDNKKMLTMLGSIMLSGHTLIHTYSICY